ncbi:MAG: hypothetical protein M3O82_05910, partial [Verrucomicrobiota bacterium]|nr:hypothetical protein [Verrucomicrobiota bacterium]
PPFEWRRDTFAFANDTLRIYEFDTQGRTLSKTRKTPPKYTRRCFVLCRSVLQFYKFARFEPNQPRVSPAEYRNLIRHISKIPVWFPANRRIVVPGYADLRHFSADHEPMLQEDLGVWWAVYLRIGNWRMAYGFPRAWQDSLAHRLTEQIDAGGIQALFLTCFRPLNHCVIAFGYERLTNGDIAFICYDPNNADAPLRLLYQKKTQSFILPRTTYYNGGPVNVYRAYLNPWQ